jgi:hypothetical protein
MIDLLPMQSGIRNQILLDAREARTVGKHVRIRGRIVLETLKLLCLLILRG